MKKNTKRIIAFSCVVAVVAVLAAMPLLAKQPPEETGPKASILSNKVSLGNVRTELIGGGQLSEADAHTVSVPNEVKLKGFLVENGDAVTKGTAIATVDRVSVMNAITQVQETLEQLSKQIEKNGEIAGEEQVTALAGGTVKLMYAQKGDPAQQVMLEHGALAVLSLDGLMAVDLETDCNLSAGTAVTVSFSGGDSTDGKIVKNLAGEMTVTVQDKNYMPEEAVTVTAEDGTMIGTGQLYIYSPWNATAYAGTVKSVNVSVGDSLGAGKSILVLEDVGNSATYRQLIGQRQEYEELMLELFQMYQTGTVSAPCDGVVSGVDTSSVQLLSDRKGDYAICLLTNAPDGNDEMLYANYLGKVVTVASNGWVLQVSPESVPIADYKALADITIDDSQLTQTVLHTQTQIPVFSLTDGEWTLVNPSDIGNGDHLLFAANGEGELVWCVLLQKAAQQPENPESPQPSPNPGNSGRPTNQIRPSGNTDSDQEEQIQRYSLVTAQIALVTPQDTVKLSINIDELDITALQVGMTAQVKIDALGGEKHQATITQIGNTGANNGGSSKFPVELTLPRTENMLCGMNATATIVLTTEENVLTIPVDALVEQGEQTVVYTGYDEKTQTLLYPVMVKVGVSDGKTAEILEGMKENQIYYYAYYDTLEISYTPEFSGGGFTGR